MAKKRISKSASFWIMIVLIAIPIIHILSNTGNQQIEYGILTGLVTGLVITILAWVTKKD
jgi:thiamine transporter ThiT